MSKENDTFSDWAKKGYAMVDGEMKKIVPDKKVHKITPDLNSFNGAKIKNAVKSEVDGVKFDSNIEKYMHGLLRGAGIDFEFQKKYLLQEKFIYNGEAVRAITLTVDFFLRGKNMIIDTKGYANDRAPLKYKMLKKYFSLSYEVNGPLLPTIELPSNKSECETLLNRILYEH